MKINGYTSFILLFVTILGSIFQIKPVNAKPSAVQVCNKTATPILLVFATRTAQDSWTTQGWYKIPGGSCLDAYEGSTKTKYAFFYAESGNRRWQGQKGVQNNPYLCINTGKSATFKIPGMKNNDPKNCGWDPNDMFGITAGQEMRWFKTETLKPGNNIYLK